MNLTAKYQLYTQGLLEDLIDEGHLGGTKELTKKGRLEYERLLTEKFLPPPQMVFDCAHFITDDGEIAAIVANYYVNFRFQTSH